MFILDRPETQTNGRGLVSCVQTMSVGERILVDVLVQGFRNHPVTGTHQTRDGRVGPKDGRNRRHEVDVG